MVAAVVDTDTITMTHHDDGTVTVHGFPERVLISAAVLAAADESIVSVDVSLDQFLIHFTFNNGKATYQVIDFESPCFVAELQSRKMY